MTNNYKDITVNSVSFEHRGGRVFFASLPADGETRKGCRANRAAAQNHLLTILVDHMVTMDNPRRQYYQWCDNANLPMRVKSDLLGRPQLLAGEYPGPAISFSESCGNVFAALCGNESDIGIDAAASDEFQGEYPLQRVFHDRELHHALHLTGGDMAMASALLWSIKEAVVKALGCAFHLVAPRQVHVSPALGGDSGYTFPVSLSGKALMRYPMDAGRSLWVRSFPREKMWLSIALLSQPSRPVMARIFIPALDRGRISIDDQRS